MDFYALLDQVVALLRQRQRVTYRALKLQFQLDDETLEALKDELLYAHSQVRETAERGLVWTEDVEGAPAPLAPSSQSAPQAGHPPQAEAQPAPHTRPEAERRQLTVMFCDLVDSTPLSSQLDPEDLRAVLRAYQATCAEVVTRFEGHIAQYLGDGLLVYFGYPQAHEDDAQRAVRTGLRIVEAMRALNTRLTQERGVRLAVRLGIHTGLVVVGEIGEGGQQEQLAVGETPNIAARIQGLATPDSVLISEATARLIEGYFTYHDLGTQTLRGSAIPLQVYRLTGESGAQSRLDIVPARGLTPLVGRDTEAALLRERWAQARTGLGQGFLVSGEAGIGKSRLVQMLKEHVAGEPHTRLECRGSPYYQHTALYPMTDLLQRVLRWQPGEPPQERLHTLETMLSQYSLPLAETVLLLAPLVALPLPDDRYPPLTLTPQRQRQKTLEVLLTLLVAEAARQPVLFIVEDLHWVDPTTLEWLTLLLDQCSTVPLLVLLTCRPEFQSPWGLRSYLTPLVLLRLSPPQVETMVARLTGEKSLPPAVLRELLVKTDGVPLFVEELIKTVLESGLLQEREERYELTGPVPPLAIPATLHDSLMARLDRLAPIKEVAQLAATLGRTFSYELLQAVTLLDTATLQQALARLVEAELLYQRGLPPQATYLFKHALIQDAAYQSLLRSVRQQYHQRIAQVLVERFPETAETQPELLAYHYTEAGLSAPAIPYWQRSGELAVRRSANLEALSHLTKGLELLHTLPDSPERDRPELTLQTALGMALQTIKGYAAPEVDQAYTRARTLCQQVGDTAQLVSVLRGQWMFYNVRADYRIALELGQQLLVLAEDDGNPEHLVEAHLALGIIAIYLGDFIASRSHLEQGIALYNPHEQPLQTFHYIGHSRAMCLSYLARTLWLLGYAEQALQRSQEGLALAQRLSNPMTLSQAQGMHTLLYQVRREIEFTQEWSEKTIAYAAEHGFPYWLTLGSMYKGWALAQQGQLEAGTAQFLKGLEAYRTTGAKLGLSWFLAVLAELYGKSGHIAEGLRAMAEALAHINSTEEMYYEAEVHRLTGELLLMQGGPEAAAEARFLRALEVARRQSARSWELRAATSLARLWRTQGRCGAAQELLAAVYGWFTEGFDTLDLQDARRVLEELRAVS